jgi:predicted nucleic acid-binding protein
MRVVFADTLYRVALANEADPWDAAARRASLLLDSTRLVTTEEVLVEVLNALSHTPNLRRLAAELVEGLRADPLIEILEQSAASFSPGLTLYRARRDKTYGMTDCISMSTMRRLGLTEALTHDRHYEQEGFVTLIRLD